jgi:hypothetical protein
LGKIKRAIEKFLWFGHLYKIDRRQLVMSHLKGGLALTSVELKTKSLFLRANLFKKVENIFVDREDFLLVEKNTIRLPRNVQEAFTSADEVLTRNLSSTKLIYLTLLERQGFTNYIETKYTQINFNQIWKNLSANYLPSNWRATTYLVVNDVIPNSQKLRAHRIGGGNVFCTRCNYLDNNVHRLKCIGAREIWCWLTNLLRTRLNLTISDPEELLVMNLDKKHEAGLWFLTAAIHYNVLHFCGGNLNQFKNMVRNTRWAKKDILTRKFGNLLNIF